MEITSIIKILPITVTGKLYFKLYYRAQKKRAKRYPKKKQTALTKMKKYLFIANEHFDYKFIVNSEKNEVK